MRPRIPGGNGGMPNHRQIEQTAAAWLARRDGGRWHAADQAGLDAWLEASPAHRVAWLRLQAAWDESPRLRALGRGSAATSAERHAAPPDAVPDLRQVRFAAQRPLPAPRHRRGTRALLTAGLAGVVCLGLWASRTHVPPPAQAYASARGEVRTFTLADGSRVTLDGDSRITVRLDANGRHIALERGEAYFEVAHDPVRPFAVAANGRQAVAVGTRYAVRRDGGDLRVVVTQGTVRLDPPADGRRHAQPSLLPAGSIALAGPHGVLVRHVAIADAEQLTGWRDGFLAFHDTPLSEAVTEFNRQGGRPLVVADAQAGALRIGGHFRRDNADAFVRLLEQGFPVCAERTPERTVLRSCP